MALSIDTTRVPSGERAARQLVDDLRGADDRVERHYLEVKSDIDLSAPLGRAKVAKFILGAANRMPSAARKYFDGHAVMVLGVGGGEAPGIEPVEMLQLQQWLAPYLSSPPPGWDVQRVPADDGREVLLVVVDAPEQGQDMYVCGKSFNPDVKAERKHSLREGAIYVRGDGETREANSDDMAALKQRGSGSPMAGVSVLPEGSALRYIAETRGIKRWINEQGDKLLALLPSAKPQPVNSTYDAFAKAAAPSIADVVGKLGAGYGLTKPEDRTEAQYRAEVEAWKAEAVASLPTGLDNVAAAAWTPLVFRIESDAWLEDVELQIHLEGEVRGVEKDRYGRRRGLRDITPPTPRAWGPRKYDAMGLGVAAITRPMSTPRLPTRATFTNGGSVQIVVQVGDIRPDGSVLAGDSLHMVLFVDDAHLEFVAASWHLTARDQHRVYEGRTTVPIVERTMQELIEVLDQKRSDG